MKLDAKKIIIAAVLAVVILVGAIFVPRVMHTCDDCGKFFLGTGYEANIVTELFSSGEQIICKKCAEKQHAISIALGKSVKDFKRGLFD